MGFLIKFQDGGTILVRGELLFNGDYVDVVYDHRLITRINSRMDGVRIVSVSDIPENVLYERRDADGVCEQFMPLEEETLAKVLREITGE